MAAKIKQSPAEEPIEEPVAKTESNPIILTQGQHAILSEKEKQEFRANNGTVSNQ